MSPWKKKIIFISYDYGSAISGDLKKVIDFYNWGGKHGEGDNCDNLGNAYDILGDLKKIRPYRVYIMSKDLI